MKQFLNNYFFNASAFIHALVFVGSVTFISAAQAGESVKEISVKEVKVLVENKAKNVAILDANNAEARADAGIVKGAILLTSYNQYALTELPKDKDTTLVFYCYNSYCQASHAAAERALSAGYKDARVMREGIVGWNNLTNKTNG